MPSAQTVIDGFTRVVQAWLAVGALWHLALSLALVAVAKDMWRPSARSAAIATSALTASCSLFAWIAGNALDGAVLALATVGLAAIATSTAKGPLQLGPLRARWLGAAMIVYAWFYPHYFDGRSIWSYMFASPIGLVPSPSLSVVLGLGLYSRAFGSRAWGVAAGALGLFYGVVGVARLEIWIDLPLLVAGAAMTIVNLSHATLEQLEARQNPPRTSDPQRDRGTHVRAE